MTDSKKYNASEQRREFVAKMKELAAYLKYELQELDESDPDFRDYEVKLKSGRKELVIILAGHRDNWQLKISKIYPKPFDGNPNFYTEPKSITVAYENTVDQIWQDVLRRLLKGYSKEIIEEVATNDRRMQAHERMQATTKAIADTLLGVTPTYSNDGYLGTVLKKPFHGFRAKTSAATDMVQIELELTGLETIELILFLRELKG